MHVPTSICHMISIHHPEGIESKGICLADSHRFAPVAKGKRGRMVIHLQSDISGIVNIGKLLGNSVIMTKKDNSTYGR